MELVAGPMLYINGVDFVTWVKAVNKHSGMDIEDFVAIPITGVLFEQGEGTPSDVHITLCVNPDGAKAIVNGIASLVQDGPPPKLNLPGRN